MSWERGFLGPNSPASSRATSSIVPIRSISSPRRVLSRAGRAKSLGKTPLSVRFSFSIASIALSMTLPISGLGGLELPPSGVWRHPEHVLAHVLVAVLRVDVRLLLDGVVPLLEGVEDVLEEYKPEGDVLVLACVHVPAHLIRHAQSFSSQPRFAPLPERDRSVPDCFLRPMFAPSRASHGPTYTLHVSIDRFNRFRPKVLEATRLTERGVPRATGNSRGHVVHDV